MKNKGGRPRAVIDYELLEKLCSIQCTGEEIAGVLGIDYDTLNKNIKRDKHISFTDYYKKYSSDGKVSLRRSQWKSAIENENVTMQIWLGKNMLDQTDRQETLLDNKTLAETLKEIANKLPS